MLTTEGPAPTTSTSTCCAASRRTVSYRGEQFDSDLGLYYLRARYYNPITGRFMSRDPENGNPVDPESLHKYLYAGGDPVDAMDPTGRAELFEKALVEGGSKLTATEIVLTSLQQGATQFWTAVQLYAGIAYLTAQQRFEWLINLITYAKVTGPLARLYACNYLGFQIAEHLETTHWTTFEKYELGEAFAFACGTGLEKFTY